MKKFKFQILLKSHLQLLAFKVAADPFVGQITFCRLYCGNLSSGSTILNSSKNQKERIGRMLIDAFKY